MLAGIILLAFFLPALSQASDGEEYNKSPAPWESLWWERTRLAGMGDYGRAEKIVNEMLLQRLNLGVSNLQLYSASLIEESRNLAGNDKNPRSHQLLKQARDLAPDFYGPNRGQARYYLKTGRIFDALATALSGVRKKYSAFNTAYPSLFNLLSVFLSAYFWALLLFAAFLLIRHTKLLAHELQERGAGFDKRSSMVMVSALVLFPVAFVPNIFLYALLVLLITWIYMRRGEKIVAAVLTVLILILPLPFRFLGNGISAMSEPAFEAVVKVREEMWGQQEITRLREALNAGENGGVSKSNLKLSLAKSLANRGEYQKAITVLQGIESGDEETEALSSFLKGNTYYRWGKYSEALKWYEKAARMLPEGPVVHYNLAMVLGRPEIVDLSADNVDRSEDEIRTVKSLAPDLMETWTEYQELNPGRFVVPMQLPLGRIWSDLWRATPRREQVADTMFKSYSGGVPLDAVPFVVLGCLLLMGLLTVVDVKVPHAAACKVCGTPFCKKCQPVESAEDMCVRCRNITGMKTGIDPRTRERARAEIRLKQERKVLAAEIITILVPGIGHLLLGKSVRGLVLTFVSSLVIFGFIYRHGILRSEWIMPAYSNILPLILGAFVYLVYIGISVWNVSTEK